MSTKHKTNLPQLVDPQYQEVAEEIESYFKDKDLPDIYEFFKSKKYDIKSTIKIIEEDLKWRKEKNVDNILDYFLKENKFASDLIKYWPSGMHGEDKRGLPVFYERLGMVNSQSLLSIIDKKTMSEFHTYVLEKNERYFSEKTLEKNCNGEDIAEGAIIVEDLKDLGVSQFYIPALQMAKENLKNHMDHYPPGFKKIYVVNAPNIFESFWKVIKPVLNDDILEKVKFLDHNFLEELKKEIVWETIPDFLGGPCHNYEIGKGGTFTSILQNSNETFIPSRGKFSKVIEIQEGYLLLWEFSTKSHNVGFSILCEGYEVVKYRIYESEKRNEGSLQIQKSGMYTLRWDNSFSWVTGKTLFYNIVVAPPNIEEID